LGLNLAFRRASADHDAHLVPVKFFLFFRLNLGASFDFDFLAHVTLLAWLLVCAYLSGRKISLKLPEVQLFHVSGRKNLFFWPLPDAASPPSRFILIQDKIASPPGVTG
jgi:hypothetical protein